MLKSLIKKVPSTTPTPPTTPPTTPPSTKPLSPDEERKKRIAERQAARKKRIEGSVAAYTYVPPKSNVTYRTDWRLDGMHKSAVTGESSHPTTLPTKHAKKVLKKGYDVRYGGDSASVASGNVQVARDTSLAQVRFVLPNARVFSFSKGRKAFPGVKGKPNWHTPKGMGKYNHEHDAIQRGYVNICQTPLEKSYIDNHIEYKNGYNGYERKLYTAAIHVEDNTILYAAGDISRKSVEGIYWFKTEHDAKAALQKVLDTVCIVYPSMLHPILQTPNWAGKNCQTCRFFNTKNGCRYGPNCRFAHICPPVADSFGRLSFLPPSKPFYMDEAQIKYKEVRNDKYVWYAASYTDPQTNVIYYAQRPDVRRLRRNGMHFFESINAASEALKRVYQTWNTIVQQRQRERVYAGHPKHSVLAGQNQYQNQWNPPKRSAERTNQSKVKEDDNFDKLVKQLELKTVPKKKRQMNYDTFMTPPETELPPTLVSSTTMVPPRGSGTKTSLSDGMSHHQDDSTKPEPQEKRQRNFDKSKPSLGSTPPTKNDLKSSMERDDETMEDEGPAKKKRKESGGLSAVKEISDQLAEFFGSGKEMARTEVVKQLWAYIKEHNLQNPDDKREIILDEKMKSVFHCDRFTQFTMNKYLNMHIHPFTPVNLNELSENSKKKKQEAAERRKAKEEKKKNREMMLSEDRRGGLGSNSKKKKQEASERRKAEEQKKSREMILSEDRRGGLGSNSKEKKQEAAERRKAKEQKKSREMIVSEDRRGGLSPQILCDLRLYTKAASGIISFWQSTGGFQLPSGEVFVQQRIAKDFTAGLFFGTVVEYLPPTTRNRSDEYWKVVYDDGDEEDMDIFQLEEALYLYHFERTGEELSKVPDGDKNDEGDANNSEHVSTDESEEEEF